MKFILGTKQNMTQYWGEDGLVSPATIVKAEPMTITQVKTTETDGYNAVQVGTGSQKKERLSKSVLGHTKGTAYKTLSEFRVDQNTQNVGDVVDVSVFQQGDTVTVSGLSKGKGFQGVVKRHGFHGGRRSHGQKHSEREPGSIGGGLRTRVPKGMRMAGRMGNDRVSVKNLEVLFVDSQSGTMLIKGALPGRKGTLLEITA